MMPLLPFVPFSRAGLASTDEEWVRLGSPNTETRRLALGAIYRREAAAVYRYALALCGNAGWAADATQEAFVALAARPRAYDPARGTLGAYLAGAARHGLAAQWRLSRREAPLPDDEDEASGDITDVISPEALLVRAQDSAEVWAALRRLPAPFREAVVLVDLQDRPYAVAAQIAGIELNTLRTRLHRGRLRLAALLGGDPGSTP
jgi:RNA polymerase sigma-70 factor (ECF subfamily)